MDAQGADRQTDARYGLGGQQLAREPVLLDGGQQPALAEEVRAAQHPTNGPAGTGWVRAGVQAGARAGVRAELYKLPQNCKKERLHQIKREINRDVALKNCNDGFWRRREG